MLCIYLPAVAVVVFSVVNRDANTATAEDADDPDPNVGGVKS